MFLPAFPHSSCPDGENVLLITTLASAHWFSPNFSFSSSIISKNLNIIARPLVVCSSRTIRSTSNYFRFNVLFKYSFLIFFFCSLMWEQIKIFMSFNKRLESVKTRLTMMIDSWAQFTSIFTCLSDSSRALLTHYAVHTVHASTSTNDPLIWWIFFDLALACNYLETGKKETRPWLCSVHSGDRLCSHLKFIIAT